MTSIFAISDEIAATLTNAKSVYIYKTNNYLTVEKFAEHQGLSIALAKKILDLGQHIHEKPADAQHPMDR